MSAPAIRPTSGPTRPPTTWGTWLRAVRPFSFTASVTPLVVASAFAVWQGRFDPVLAGLMLAAAVACHAGANLANDYYDHVNGVDTSSSFGPSGVIQQGNLTLAHVRRGMIVAFAVATLLGLVIVRQTGWPILLLALASLGAAWAYTGGPLPLGYVALGEVTVFLSMGLGIVAGAAYALTDQLNAETLLTALPIGFLVAAILHVNNVRDMTLDAAAGKRTLAVLLDRRGALLELGLLVAAAYPFPLLLVLADPRLWPVLFAFATVPRAIRLIRLVAAAPDAATLNPAVRLAAGLHLRFGLALAVGFLLAAGLRRLLA